MKVTKKKIQAFRLTEKGLAWLAAIETGLIPLSEDGKGDPLTRFGIFWNEFERLRLKHRIRKSIM